MKSAAEYYTSFHDVFMCAETIYVFFMGNLIITFPTKLYKLYQP